MQPRPKQVFYKYCVIVERSLLRSTQLETSEFAGWNRIELRCDVDVFHTSKEHFQDEDSLSPKRNIDITAQLMNNINKECLNNKGLKSRRRTN